MHYKTRVDLGEYLGKVEVSTLDTADSGWETCLFFSRGGSQVVTWYPDGVAAREGHKALSHEVVLRVITSMYNDLAEGR